MPKLVYAEPGLLQLFENKTGGPVCWETVGDFTIWLKTFAVPIRWAKPKAER